MSAPIMHTLDTREAAAVATADAVATYLLDRAEQPTMLLFAGGSVPTEVVPHVPTKGLGQHVTVGVFDERCSADPAEQNEQLLQSTDWYQAARTAGVGRIVVGVGEAIDCVQTAGDWEEQLRAWRAAHPDGEIAIVAGVGTDAHIGGLLPSSGVWSDEDPAWVRYYNYPETDDAYPRRLTPTPHFLRDVVARAFIYIVGSEKADALQAIVADAGEHQQTTSRLVWEVADVHIYTDQAVETGGRSTH